MVETLEEITAPVMTEFIGPNFNYNGYCDARYRMSNNKIKLVNFGAFEVPMRLEALDENGKWKQHPVVFVNYGSYEARKSCEGELVIFHSGKCHSTIPFRSLSFPAELFKEAGDLGLTEGDTMFVKPIAREED